MTTRRGAKGFPVVCAGLGGWSRRLQHLPSNMGFAIVIVNHPRRLAAIPAGDFR